MAKKFRRYKTAAGKDVVKEELQGLHPDGSAALMVALKLYLKGECPPGQVIPLKNVYVTHKGVRHPIYEIRVRVGNNPFRLLFALLGNASEVVFTVRAFYKNQRKTPPAELTVAKNRLRDWLERGDT